MMWRLAFTILDNVNPSDGLNAIPKLINNLISLSMFVVGAVSVIFVIVGGIRYSVSAGNPKAIEDAKKTIFYAVGGLTLAIMALAIVNFAKGLFPG